MLKPQTSTVDEMIRSLSDEQKEMLIFGIQDSSNFLTTNKMYPEKEKLIEALA